jgi:hypothetical protein
MIRRMGRARAGITLTEILIAILIMGVGLTSLATLFPLGLLRLRDAQRWSRAKYLQDVAASDLESRHLLNYGSFYTGTANLPTGAANQFISPWYNLSTYTTYPYNPWVQDTPSSTPLTNATGGVYRGNPLVNPSTGVAVVGGLPTIPGPGLPVAYDPLWRYQANPTPAVSTSVYSPPIGIYPGNSLTEARFGSGLGNLLGHTDNGGGGAVSAYGLQRVTNFDINQTAPVNAGLGYVWLWGPTTVPDIFVGHEDVVLQSGNGPQTGFGGLAIPAGASTVVPDMSGNAPVEEWHFSWSFTGQQSDALNTAVFDGDIVIWENRPFGTTTVNGQVVADGETVVEGVFGYAGGAGSIAPLAANNSVGFARNATRSVLLRWPATIVDPEVKVGNWIADVTYERNLATQGIPTMAAGRWQVGDYPYQRCYWYQIVKRTEPVAESATSGSSPAVGLGQGGYRCMTVWVSSPLKAQTLLNVNTGQPAHNNAALIAPNVVAVFPRVIYAH